MALRYFGTYEPKKGVPILGATIGDDIVVQMKTKGISVGINGGVAFPVTFDDEAYVDGEATYVFSDDCILAIASSSNIASTTSKDIAEDMGEPTGFIRGKRETLGVMELCTDGTEVISVDHNSVATIRNDGLWLDGTTANAREFAFHPVPHTGTIGIRNEETGAINIIDDPRDSAYFSVYIKSLKYNFSDKIVITLDDSTGLKFIYFDGAGNLQHNVEFSFDCFEDTPIVATVYGNATTQALVNYGDERHGIVMDGFTHRYLHFTEGCRYQSGMGITGLTSLETTHGLITGGTAYDEDILIFAEDQTNVPFLYRLGTDWYLEEDTTQIAKLNGAQAVWNENTGTNENPNFVLTDVAGNDVVNTIFALTNNKEFPYVKILGQTLYADKTVARGDVENALKNINKSGLPSPEFCPIGVVIVDDSGQLLTQDDGSLYYDVRGVQL